MVEPAQQAKYPVGRDRVKVARGLIARTTRGRRCWNWDTEPMVVPRRCVRPCSFSALAR
jgi:hypothetical protein